MTGMLADRAWPEVERPTLLVPLGSLEQHGPHLPLDTDTRIAHAVAERLAATRGREALVAPALAYGSSGEHDGFPGTVSIGGEALRSVLLEYARSASAWAATVVFVNGHGGNAEAVRQAVATLRDEEARAVAWTPCAPDEGWTVDAHAGRTETSLLLHLAPEHVRLERAVPGARDPLAALLPRLRRDGVRAVSPSGVLGDPAGASAEEGAALLDAMVGHARRRLAEFGAGPW
ncbi:mycofactocin biosynthesis peptidyl-dipeptidase MftE [Microbacterium sp. Marseille-Q6965]|uniref:mycofactocin biosynthesis peptidyl-dipeptidase MftE n=1 Tax=Microbacterium sp. Marseille-Q6965 TaxID=2965072 RepID=UPI0021B6FA18|nr:mycofactocin biosynthesis peptidyl-dipeptidase MftE [Microbacterium sp. Marseille-Q6965]